MITPEPGLVIMMCGIAGSGKTTFAKSLEKQGFNRLSIDEEIWSNYGKFGIDYSESEYDSHQKHAKEIVENKLLDKLKLKIPTVLDLSFWSKSERDRVRKIISNNHGHHQIVYLKVAPEVLRARLKVRSERFDANAAFTITDEILNRYLSGFEEPCNEGELVIQNH